MDVPATLLTFYIVWIKGQQMLQDNINDHKGACAANPC